MNQPELRISRFRRPGLLDTPGKRVYAAILVVLVAFVLIHFGLALWLMRASGATSSLLKMALAVTIFTGIVGSFQLVQFLVFSVILLARRGRPFVPLPQIVAESDLPTILAQIPGRNEPVEQVQRTIESVRALNYPSNKILIQHIDNSDDRRSEDLSALYASDPRVAVIHRDGTRGYKAGNLNLGWKCAPAQTRGKPLQELAIVVLNVGDTLAPDSLRFMASEFVQNESLGFVQSLLRVGNPNESIITKVESCVTNAIARFLFGCQNTYGMPMTSGSVVAIRAQALIEVGGWDENTVAEDWSTGMKMTLRGWRGKWVDYQPTDGRVVSGEASAATLEGQQKQKNRWANGSAELMKLYAGEWMRSFLPWNQKLDLLMRLLAYPTAAIRYCGMLSLPFWLAISVVARFRYSLAQFPIALALLSASLQNAFLLFLLSVALIYVREHRPKDAFYLLCSFPVQMIYTLPIVPHIARGLVRGLRHVPGIFLVTPKGADRRTIMGTLVRQRLALLSAAWWGLPALIVYLIHPAGYGLFVSVLLGLSMLMLLGIFMVPISNWVLRQGLVMWMTNARNKRKNQVV